jgi:hypothetical protein
MEPLSKYDFRDHESASKNRTQTSQQSLSSERKESSLAPISLPYDIWTMILWYLLEPAISPHTYCNSDTFPQMNFQFIYTHRPNCEEWFRYRLVCRTWNEIMGPYPLVICPQSLGRPLLLEEDLTRVKGIFLDKYRSYKKEIDHLHRYPQLKNQVTLLFSREYPTVYLRPADRLFEFSNLRFLCLGWVTPQSDEIFLKTLSEGCPRLVWLHIHGNMRWIGTLRLFHLEFLGLRLVPEQETEPSYDFPKLTHFSFTGMILPQQLTHQYGPFLRSLLVHYIRPLDEVKPDFWKHYASLRTFGFYPSTDRPVVGPPPDHPLRHLCIFLSHSNHQRIQLVETTLPNFPHILKLTIEIPNLTKEEENILLEMAERSNLELRFMITPAGI